MSMITGTPAALTRSKARPTSLSDFTWIIRWLTFLLDFKTAVASEWWRPVRVCMNTQSISMPGWECASRM
ncbi:hypothetical protein D3C85_1429150 [compost metagenome]